MEKILLLGGSNQQVIAIETAKKLGYYTILCDYLPDNPGQNYADKFYLESTTDKEKILEIARKEKINGILAYASDPAAPTAAYVSEKLGLPGNPYKPVETLCNKDKFREFLSKNGFNTPRYKMCESIEDVLENIEKLQFPIIIKPVDSSGSKGISVIYNLEHIKEKIEYAFSFSRSKKIIIEEFLEVKNSIGGDIFIQDGKIILYGFLDDCKRDNKSNLLVPVGKKYPVSISNEKVQQVKNILQDLVDKLQIKTGAMNIELIIDKNDLIYLIDIGPRNGGAMIPQLLGYIYGIDLVKTSIEFSMNKKIKIKINEKNAFYASYYIHSYEEGRFVSIEFSSEINSYIIEKNIYKKNGDKVEFFENASKALGVILFKFNSREQMEYYLDNINNHIKIKLKY